MKLIIGAAVAALLSTAAAAQHKPAPAAEAAAQPGLGEIMTLQQLRHIKLWFAGRAGNWALADYEIGELKEGFDDATQLLGGDVMRQHVGEPMTALEKSIDSKDGVLRRCLR